MVVVVAVVLLLLLLLLLLVLLLVPLLLLLSPCTTADSPPRPGQGGTLDRDEIGALARGIGHKLTDRELDAAMEEMDEDGAQPTTTAY